MVVYRPNLTDGLCMKHLTEFNSWRILQKEAETNRLKPALATDQSDVWVKSHAGIRLDYSRQRLTPMILDGLIHLAHELNLKEKIDCLMSGDKVNLSEQRAALHTALRHAGDRPIWVNDENVILDVQRTQAQIQQIANQVRAQEWVGYTGQPITDIVNVGIGGSDLGPRLSISALGSYTSKDLAYHFISDVDPQGFNEVIKSVHLPTTLFILTSKSFTTKETLLNAAKLFALYDSPQAIERHMIAVTAHPERAKAMGIKTILPIWDWVGGRYSFCSAVNLITAIAIGYEHFSSLLNGAFDMDQHARQAEFKDNLPALLALTGIWNNNFLNAHQLVMLSYTKHLEYFVPYIQQLDMESNGKSITQHGTAVTYATGPVVWGGLGNQAQHSYFQLLAQGTHRCAAEFISLASNDQQMINYMCDYKMLVLSEGVTAIDQPNRYIPGRMPINHLQLSEMTPSVLGALVALYEHKVFIQSVIWDINPFDQPGIDSSKSINRFTEMLIE